jgi:hypothetical protein
LPPLPNSSSDNATTSSLPPRHNSTSRSTNNGRPNILYDSIDDIPLNDRLERMSRRHDHRDADAERMQRIARILATKL